MSGNFTLIRSAVILLAAAVLAPSALAQPAPGTRPLAFAAGQRLVPGVNRVLTDAQRRALRAALETQRVKILPLAKQLLKSRRAVLDAAVAQEFDEAVVRRDAADAAEAEAKLTVIYARALAEMKPPLSAQQREQLKNFARGPAPARAAEPPAAPGKHLPLPPPLPRDTNDLPVMK
jgi:Spy/CpxP family protein refolding chaperone